jgi:hypothetical protein
MGWNYADGVYLLWDNLDTLNKTQKS